MNEEVHHMINMKSREVYCPNCKFYSVRNTPTPVCNFCGQPLITVVYSMIDGRKLTGTDELGSTGR